MTTAVKHTHWWVVSTPEGPTVDAYCKGCPAHRTYLSAGPRLEDETKRRQRSYDGGKAEVELSVLGDLPRRSRKRLSAEVR